MNVWTKWGLMLMTTLLLLPVSSQAGEMKIVLRDYLQQQWSNELLTYPLSAPRGACLPQSVTLTGPRGPVPVQLTDVVTWPDGKSVKTAKVTFITDLTPLATDTYTVHYGTRSVAPLPSDLKIVPGNGQVEITTKGFGARLLLGETRYPTPVSAATVPAPVIAMRLTDGTWFGGSRMYGEEKLTSYSAKLTDSGPVLARVAIHYTFASGNTLDVALRIVAGDNTIRMETAVPTDAPHDGFNLVLSRGLPGLLFQVQDEARQDRPCFPSKNPGGWEEIPLKDYASKDAKSDYAAWPLPRKDGENTLVTTLTPWEDWFGTFTQTRIRLKLENTNRELQVRSVNPGTWVKPVEIEEIFSDKLDPDPQKGMWAAWQHKMMPLYRAPDGEIFIHVNMAQGERKWTISDCLSVPGFAGIMSGPTYQPERAFPREARSTVGTRLDDVKDYVLEWRGDADTHPRLFSSRAEIEAFWKHNDVDAKELNTLMASSRAKSAEDILKHNEPIWGTWALGAYLLSGGSPKVAQEIQLAARLHQALEYDLWGVQFGCAGNPAPILYDGLIDSPVIPEADRQVLRARMACYAYRLADPAVWSAERGYCSGNQNMTVTWEISRGITACAIPTHPMAKTWYRKAERIMDYFLSHMVGPAGEWPESMGQHGRQSIDMLLAFAVASSHSGLHDYINDPRVKRMVTYWAKMQTPRDPRPRGWPGAQPNRRYFLAMGRDAMSMPGGTCGVLANLLRETDPALSAELQWAWKEEGANASLNHLGGYDRVVCDRTLPARQPAWTSEVLPYAAAIFRHGFGTENEHQVQMYSGDHFAAFYPGHAGSFPSIFAYGTPVAGAWPGSYSDQEDYLLCHVMLARGRGSLDERKAVCGHVGNETNANMWSWPTGQLARFSEHGGSANVSSFSTLPRQDYAAVDVALHYPRTQYLPWRQTLPEWPPVAAKGQPPVDWRRQTLFLKDDDPAGTAYLLIRDSVKGIRGPQPTMWQMWTVSETLDTPEQVQDVAAVLARKPGDKILPARELKGNRFTAIGQLGVDVEYYIAAPLDTPRHTLRWGIEFVFENTNRMPKPEYQDLLHLQLPGDGAYYVAFFPRKRNTPAPTFTTLGNGLIIKVKGAFGTDYGFLSAQEATATSEESRFVGTVGSVQDRNNSLVLSLGAKGEVHYRTYGVKADVPASLRIRDKELTVELPATLQPPAFQLAQPFPGSTLTLTVPGNLALAGPQAGVKLNKTAAGWVLTVAAGITRVKLTAE